MTGQKQTPESTSSNSEDNNLYREISELIWILNKIKTLLIVTQDPVQPLCNPVNVSEADILEQENKGF